MVCAVFALGLNGGVVHAAAVAAILANPAGRDHRKNYVQTFLEHEEDELAYRLIENDEPHVNRLLFELFKRDKDVRSMLKLPVKELPLPIVEFIYRQDEASMDSAVAFIKSAELKGEELALSGARSTVGLNSDVKDQVIDLCLLLSTSGYKHLAARVFEKYIDKNRHANENKVALYLGYLAKYKSELDAYFPKGLSTLPAVFLVQTASLVEHHWYDNAAVHALISGDKLSLAGTKGQISDTTLFLFLEKLVSSGRINETRAIVDKYRTEVLTEVRNDIGGNFAMILVRCGREDVLKEAADSVWSLARLETGPERGRSIGTARSERLAQLYALAGRADIGQDVVAHINSFNPSYRIALDHTTIHRFIELGRLEEAASLAATSDSSTGHLTADICLKRIDAARDVQSRQTIARESIATLLARRDSSYWDRLEVPLLTLGLKQELKSLLDQTFAKSSTLHAGSADAFRAYLAVGDGTNASKLVFRSSQNKGMWLVQAIGPWKTAIHGDVEATTRVLGRDVFSEGLVLLRSAVHERPAAVGAYTSLLRGVQDSPRLVDLTLTELRATLDGLPPESRVHAEYTLIDKMYSGIELPLLRTDIQGRVLAFLRN